MPGFLRWFNGPNFIIRITATVVMMWTLSKVWSATGAILPFLIIALAWGMEYLSWQQGVVDGAMGWDQLPESKKEEVRKMLGSRDE